MSTQELMTLGRKEIQETDDSLFRAQKLVANTIEVCCMAAVNPACGPLLLATPSTRQHKQCLEWHSTLWHHMQVGTKVAETLEGQTHQMEKIQGDLDEIKFTLKKAQKVIRDITRSMATDKCARCLQCVVLQP